MKKKRAAKTQLLDLSRPPASPGATPPSPEFEVLDYDYRQLQNELSGFEEDLAFLLSAPDAAALRKSTRKKKATTTQSNGMGSSTEKATKAGNTPPKSKKAAKRPQVSQREITDLTGIELSDSETDELAAALESFHDLGNGSLAKVLAALENCGEVPEAPEQGAAAAPLRIPEAEVLKGPEAEALAEDAETAPQKSKKRVRRKKKRAQVKDSLHASDALEALPPLDVSPAPSTPSASTPEPGLGRHSSSTATKKVNLPAVQPMSTIFGLLHLQIFTMPWTDVKIKMIVNFAQSKMCKNALAFAMAERDGLFADPDKRSHFVTLCVHVALYESPGFHKVTKKYPQILLWAETYPALTLPHTKTSLTLSKKAAHKNELDYSVFAFFGHVLVWAHELQREAKLPSLLAKYDLNFSQNQLVSSLGGYHLWDRLLRDKTINLKRWKHIQKFRAQFPFELHQFVLILRCLNPGLEIP